MRGDVRASDADQYAAASFDPWPADGGQRGERPDTTYQIRPGWARLRRRVLVAVALAALCAVTLVSALIAVAVFHGGWLGIALLVLLALGALAVAAAAGVTWIGWRMWRRGAWLEALPLLAGQPWLSRVVWAVRLLWTGHALWRLRARLRPAPRY